MIHADAFAYDGYTGTELENAINAHSRLGYNYVVTKVGVISTAESKISIDVTLMQIGVAPFYYPLSLQLNCSGSRKVVNGLEKSLNETNDVKLFRFDDVPMDIGCLQSIKLQLVSTMSYDGRPIKFAQGDGTVSFSVPLPERSFPTRAPVLAPAIPVSLPSPERSFPTRAPISAPRPVTVPTRAPITRSFPTRTPISAPSVPLPARAFPTRAPITRSFPTRTPISDPSVPVSLPLPDRSFPTIAPMSRSFPIRTPISAPSLPVSVPIPERAFPTQDPMPAPSLLFTTMTLIDTENGEKIGIMTNTTIINIANDRNISIVAEPPQSFGAGSVQFVVDDQIIRTENTAPFMISGNSDGIIQPWNPSLGEHTIKAIPFTEKDASGDAGIPVIIKVTVVEKTKFSIFQGVFKLLSLLFRNYIYADRSLLQADGN
jgi:hypothetical protein